MHLAEVSTMTNRAAPTSGPGPLLLFLVFSKRMLRHPFFFFREGEYHGGMEQRKVYPEQSRRVAVFDIDGTIFRSSLLLELVERLIENGIFPKEARAQFATERDEWLDRKGDYETYIGKA